MSTSTNRTRPNLLERVKYLMGMRLPDSMRDWVVNDATGPGHNRRFFIRGALMFLPFVVVALALPSPLWVKLALVAMMALPAIVFIGGLRSIYLQELLADNGIDPHTESGRQRERHHRRARVYEAKYRHRAA
ncbi:hypothetical protein SAMN04489765_1151 [Tsukamurella pulmonis]|uniref:Uncharacterized protein n=1 Tax=Tsukamurella pulmonis TaxID=47312 RepID=A0A1H1CDB2_9ACTN|nr:DUF5313 family protein [Tsukamurella pulmonis]SDQ62191.1 hypothetical protein SAMN04489765_1151 [Tsukamurella pulmonis]SUP23844.1 Uncharacterised protein [Tsukamurella pulmonis]